MSITCCFVLDEFNSGSSPEPHFQKHNNNISLKKVNVTNEMCCSYFSFDYFFVCKTLSSLLICSRIKKNEKTDLLWGLWQVQAGRDGIASGFAPALWWHWTLVVFTYFCVSFMLVCSTIVLPWSVRKEHVKMCWPKEAPPLGRHTMDHSHSCFIIATLGGSCRDMLSRQETEDGGCDSDGQREVWTLILYRGLSCKPV